MLKHTTRLLQESNADFCDSTELRSFKRPRQQKSVERLFRLCYLSGLSPIELLSRRVYDCRVRYIRGIRGMNMVWAIQGTAPRVGQTIDQRALRNFDCWRIVSELGRRFKTYHPSIRKIISRGNIARS